MEIISRQQAIIERKAHYFTGVPCKRNHISPRYTKTANCSECLHPKFDNAPDPRRIAKQQLERLRIGIDKADLEQFTSMVYALSVLTEPALTLSDVVIKGNPAWRGGDLFVYGFRIFPEHKKPLYQIARDMGWYRLSPQLQASLIESQERRVDGWVPPPLRLALP